LPVAGPAPVAAETVERIVAALQAAAGPRTAVLMRGAALQAEALESAGRIAAATGCRVLCANFAPRLDRGAGVVAVERIPYFAEAMVEFLKDVDRLVLVGAKPPVAFFAYPGKPSWCLPEGCEILHLAHEHEDGPGALAALADALQAPIEPASRVALALPEAPIGKFNAFTIGQAIARHLPEGAILSDDGATSSQPVLAACAGARRHTHLPLTGGSIGQGLPVAAGAAVACPDRKVVCLTGDGSGLYTPQALWTMAREGLDVTTVVFVNRAYKILGVELGRVGVAAPGDKARAMLELRRPDVDWCALAQGFGVEATCADTIAAFDAQFADAMSRPGPRLIEAVIG
jgi:acetolactate synthase-1/2/3 large subunit